jgi:hypothetical protein
MNIFNYMHAPAIGFWYLGALIFSVCVLQKPRPLPLKRRRLLITMMFATLLVYFAELLYYLVRAFADAGYTTPHDAVINCLGSVLVWGPLSVSLVSSSPLRWAPYFGTFVLHFAFETTLCLLGGLAVPSDQKDHTIPLVFHSIRAIASLLLLLDGFLILIRKRGDNGSDEEGQSLLGKQTNGHPVQNGNLGYGSINPDSSTNGESSFSEREREIREKQAKRLEEEGGWFGYLRGFAIFLPHLWPKDDKVIMFCLFLRAVNLIQGRVFNLLAPRQLGIITNKLAAGTRIMPWKDVGLWTFYKWINSYSGFGAIDSIANYVIQNKS